MRIVIITGTLPHHKHLCVELGKRFEIVGIFHPEAIHTSLGVKLSKVMREVRKAGLTYTLLRLAGKRLGQAVRSVYLTEEKQFFGAAPQAFQRMFAGISHHIAEINSSETINMIRGLAPDIMISLGGPIYKKRLIAAAPLMLNWHSGISPIYNGSSTVEFAFANGHPHLAGGTLMLINPVIDGGDILAHYFPSITRHDTPATLFMKILGGAIFSFSEALSHLASGGNLKGIPQHNPLFEVKAMDWTLYHSLRSKRLLKEKICSKYLRNETHITYWKEPNAELATNIYHQTILNYMFGAK